MLSRRAAIVGSLAGGGMAISFFGNHASGATVKDEDISRMNLPFEVMKVRGADALDELEALERKRQDYPVILGDHEAVERLQEGSLFPTRALTSSSCLPAASIQRPEWADVIFVMERTHRNKLAKQFRAHLKDKRVVCLDIRDEYEYMDPALIRLLEVKVGPFFDRGGSAS